MKGGLFIAGTDTGVGKTWVAVRLLRLLRERGLDAVGMKPVECGGREDATALHEAAGKAIELDEVNPYALAEPLAPAAVEQAPRIDFETVKALHRGLSERHDFVIVEGAGGWLVPLDRERTMADLAASLGLPVLLVAANRLGVLNHVLLTVRAIAASGLECDGVFLNTLDGEDDPSRASNARVLREILPTIPVIDGDLEALVLLPAVDRSKVGTTSRFP